MKIQLYGWICIATSCAQVLAVGLTLDETGLPCAQLPRGNHAAIYSHLEAVCLSCKVYRSLRCRNATGMNGLAETPPTMDAYHRHLLLVNKAQTCVTYVPRLKTNDLPTIQDERSTTLNDMARYVIAIVNLVHTIQQSTSAAAGRARNPVIRAVQPGLDGGNCQNPSIPISFTDSHTRREMQQLGWLG